MHRHLKECIHKEAISQNHRVTEVGQDLCRSSGPTLMLKAGSARTGYVGLYLVGFWTTPGVGMPENLWQICSYVWSPS